MKAEPSVTVPISAKKPSAVGLELWADFLGAVGVFLPLVAATVIHFLTPFGSGSYLGIAIGGIAIGLAVHLATATSRPARAVGFAAAGTILSWWLWMALLPSTATALAAAGILWVAPATVVIRRADSRAAARADEEFDEEEARDGDSD